MNRPIGGDVEQRVIHLVAIALAVDETRLHRDTRLFEDLGIDSMALVDVVAALEDAFGIAMPSTQDPILRTVDDVVCVVRERVR